MKSSLLIILISFFLLPIVFSLSIAFDPDYFYCRDILGGNYQGSLLPYYNNESLAEGDPLNLKELDEEECSEIVEKAEKSAEEISKKWEKSNNSFYYMINLIIFLLAVIGISLLIYYLLKKRKNPINLTPSSL